MQEPPLESEQVGNPPPTKGDSTVWRRLRNRMDEIAAANSGEIDQQALARKLAARAQLLRQRVEERRVANVDLCTFVAFSQRGQRYGIPLDEVLEITMLTQLAPVPGSPSFIPGVIHWRGAVLALLDLERLFEVPILGLADLVVCVIVEAAGRRVAIAAENVEDIISVPKDELMVAPDLSDGISDTWIVGVHDESRLILCMTELFRDPRLADFRRQRTRGNAASRSS